MKALINLLFLLLAFSTPCQSQFMWWLNFEEGIVGPSNIPIQFVSNETQCTWQVGSPAKNNFQSSYSPLNAIVTDLNNPYPPNDSSSFVLAFTLVDYGAVMTFMPFMQPLRLHFWYQSDCDTLQDYGTISFSMDNGISWVNALSEYFDPQDPNIQAWGGNNDIPTLTGSSNGWQESGVNLFLWHAGQPTPGDTILIRFGFVSDDIDTARDGLMFDDILIDDSWLSVKEQNQQPFSITMLGHDENQLQLMISDLYNSTYSFRIFDLNGRLIHSSSYHRCGANSVSLQDLGSGVYIIEVSDNERKGRVQTEKFFR